MAKLTYSPENILEILLHAIGMMCTDMGKRALSVITNTQIQSFGTFERLLQQLQQADHPLGPITARGMLTVKKRMVELHEINYFKQAELPQTACTQEQQRMQASILYNSLIKQTLNPWDNDVMQFYFFIESLPYFSYLLSRIVIYRRIDPEAAFKNGSPAYDLHAGFEQFLQTELPEIELLYLLATNMWSICDQVTLMMVNTPKMAS